MLKVQSSHKSIQNYRHKGSFSHSPRDVAFCMHFPLKNIQGASTSYLYILTPSSYDGIIGTKISQCFFISVPFMDGISIKLKGITPFLVHLYTYREDRALCRFVPDLEIYLVIQCLTEFFLWPLLNDFKKIYTF